MIVTAQHCNSVEPYFDRLVPSESSPGHFYTVRVNFVGDTPDMWTCTCPSFQHRRGACKHIRLLANYPMCGWHELTGPEKQTAQQKSDCICPRCGNMTTEELEDDGKETTKLN